MLAIGELSGDGQMMGLLWLRFMQGIADNGSAVRCRLRRPGRILDRYFGSRGIQ